MDRWTSTLWRATLNDDDARAIELICSGANVNVPRKTNYDPVTTLLHYATMKKDADRMRLLINHGANCNARDSYGNTPLHWAVHWHMEYEDRPDIVEVLINGGASLEVKNCLEFTPFLLGVVGNYYESVKKLIERVASIEKVNICDGGALYGAVNTKNLRMIKMLVSHNINVNTKNGFKQNTALHEACISESYDVAALLVKSGADVHALNSDGEMALQLLRPNAPTSEPVARIIIREAVKRESLGQPICEGYRKIVQSCAMYSKLDQKCRDEIKRMQSVKIKAENSYAISFFHIFSINEEKLTTLARNKNIVAAFERSALYLALFEIYAVDIATKIQKAVRRANSLISAEDYIGVVLNDIVPAPILTNIAAYYVMDDDTVENDLE